MWFMNWIHLLRLLTLEAKIWFLISILLELIKIIASVKKKSVKDSQLQRQRAPCLCVGDFWVITDEETLRLWEVKDNTSRKYHSSDSELYLLISYYWVCMCVCTFACMWGMCMHMCALSVEAWGWLIPWDRISQSNPELSATSRPAMPACPTSAFLPGAGNTGWHLHGFWGSDLWSSHLCSKCFNHLAISLTFLLFVYLQCHKLPLPFAYLVLVDTSPTTFLPTFPRSPSPLTPFYPQDFPVYFPFKHALLPYPLLFLKACFPF